MKKLTMNRLAFSGIRANKKDYLLLGISAFLAIFAAVSTVLGTLALMQAATDRRNEAYGSEDAFVFDVQSVPENIPGVRQYGCVTVLGQVKDFPVGYYDEAAREDDVTVLDDRESQTSRTGSGMRRIVFFCGLSIAMLLLTVLLLCGSILRQIRGETRTVGTLRAVGCDERSLTQLFFRQIPETAGLAWLLVVGLHLFSAWGYLQYNWWEIRINAIASIFTALLLTGLCYLVIRRQVKKNA